ncbi:MAG: hypothetical protein ACYCUI_07050 [Vulcanimicrobiaceae bacterium]
MKFASDVFWREFHVTLRVLLVVAAATAIGFWFLHRVAPPPQPVHGPVAVFTPNPLEHTVQALIQADQLLAAGTASRAPYLQQPAIAVIRSSGIAHGLSDAQIGQLLSALKPHTVEAIAVHSALSAPTPAPTPTNAFFKQVFSAAYSADTHAMHDTVLKTDVHITRQEVPLSRVGSVIGTNGDGLSYAFVRRKQFEFDLGAVQIAGHLAPMAAVAYCLPHTMLCPALSVTMNHGAKVGASALVKF